MTNQEEIREGIEIPIRHELVKYPELDNAAVIRKASEIATTILNNLHSQGVVIKVEKVTCCEDCPHNHYDNGADSWDNRPSNHCDLLFQLPKGCHKHITNEAGYVAVEKLI